MNRVDTSTAVAALPVQNPVGTPGFFSQGAATGSPPATVPGQDWFNGVQEELIGVILDQGLAPIKSDNAQLLKAIKLLVGSDPAPGRTHNIGLAASVNAKALTIALKTKDLVDPSAVSPVDVVFRNRTLTLGNYVERKIIAPTSLVVPSGATGGHRLRTQAVGITIASPAVVIHAGHSLPEGDPVFLTTTGALPTGLSPSTTYYVKTPVAGSTYNLSLTPGGAAINTSGTQSGTHTVFHMIEEELHVYLCDDGTTRQIGLSRWPEFEEDAVYNTTAIDATADSSHALYTTSAMTAAAVRRLYVISIKSGIVPGEWDNPHTKIAIANDAGGLKVIHDSENYSHTSVLSLPFIHGTMNVRAGDILSWTWAVEATRNGADFGIIGTLVPLGTAQLEHTNIVNSPQSLHVDFNGIAAYGAGLVYKNATVMRKFAVGGTISSFGASAPMYGTTPTSQRSHARVQILRPVR